MFNECRDIQETIVDMRRALHRIPETGFDLPETRDYVASKLDEYRVEYTLCKKTTGLIGYINKGAGHTVALRTDMDALTIKEETGLSFASVHDGKMHACGHDAHTAMLLGAAKVLKEHEKELNCEVRLIFQTNEEGVRGAELMIEEGALENVEAVFGTHIGTLMGPDVPSGKLTILRGPLMASSDVFHIVVKGRGCHGSTPEKGTDPVTMACHIVLGLEEIIAREFSANDRAVITVGSIHAGAQYNVIPDEVDILGTTRSYDERVRKYMEKRIGEIASSIASAFRGSVEYTYERGCDPVVNDPAMADYAAECAAVAIGGEDVITDAEPIMVAEDFSEYLKYVPGAFLQLSTANHEKGCDGPHHTPRFDIDEDQLYKGSAVLTAIAGNWNRGR